MSSGGKEVECPITRSARPAKEMMANVIMGERRSTRMAKGSNKIETKIFPSV